MVAWSPPGSWALRIGRQGAITEAHRVPNITVGLATTLVTAIGPEDQMERGEGGKPECVSNGLLFSPLTSYQCSKGKERPEDLYRSVAVHLLLNSPLRNFFPCLLGCVDRAIQEAVCVSGVDGPLSLSFGSGLGHANSKRRRPTSRSLEPFMSPKEACQCGKCGINPCHSRATAEN